MIARLRACLRDRSGNTMVEFGILAPLMLTMLIGIVQVGFWMQSYNALRSVAADTGRHIAVQYQKGLKPSNSDMGTWAHDHAVAAYDFKATNIQAHVVNSPTQSIPGVSEKTLTMTTNMKSFLGIVGIADIPVSFSRPIFVKA